MLREQIGFEEVSRRSMTEYPGVFQILHGVLYCVLCNKIVSSQRFWNVKQHLQAHRHKELHKDQEQVKPGSGEGTTDIPLTGVKKEITSCENSLDSQEITQSTDNPTMLTPDLIRNIGHGRYIWCSIGKTPTNDNLIVVNFKFGVLSDRQCNFNEHFCSETHAAVNPILIATFFDNNITRLGGDFLYNTTRKDKYKCLPISGFNKNQVLFLITDPTLHMMSAFADTSAYPKMIHISCLAQTFQELDSFIKDSFTDVHFLITKIYAMFLQVGNLA